MIGFKAYIMGELGGVEGEFNKDKKVGICWHEGQNQAPGSGHSVSYLQNIDPPWQPWRVRPDSGVTHVLGSHGSSGRDKEEGTIIQLLQPQVPGREQGEGSDDQLLAQGHLACQGGRLWRARFLTVWSPTLIYIICFRLFWFSKWVWCWVLWLYNSSGIEVRIKVFLVNGSRICWFGRKVLSLWF